MKLAINTWTWVAWLGGTLYCISATRNPFYLGLIFLVILILTEQIGLLGQYQRVGMLLRITVVFISISAIFNSLFAHYGTTVLVTLPKSLPIIGGAITLEGIVYGAINGLLLACMFGAFTILSLALSARAIIRLVPRAYFPVAVILSIALTYLPTTLTQIRQIGEAQEVRGHHMRGVRDWLPLLMPLLIGGLERAFNLSEAMTARGFASQNDRRPHTRQAFTLLGLALLFGGWVLRLQGQYRSLGLLLLLAGAGLIVGMVWVISRGVPYTTYTQETWLITDSLILLGVVCTLLAFVLPLAALEPQTLQYNPYPEFQLPEFNLWIGLSILCLLTPMLALRRSSADQDQKPASIDYSQVGR